MPRKKANGKKLATSEKTGINKIYIFKVVSHTIQTNCVNWIWEGLYLTDVGPCNLQSVTDIMSEVVNNPLERN